MNAAAQIMVLGGAVLAAAGQVFLKIGATGANTVSDYLNPNLASGFLLYAAGAILWIAALSKLPLSKVYPYTVLTFILVYAASFAILREPMPPNIIIGATLVLAGLAIITFA